MPNQMRPNLAIVSYSDFVRANERIHAAVAVADGLGRSCIASLYGSAYAINCAPSTPLTATTMYCVPLIM